MTADGVRAVHAGRSRWFVAGAAIVILVMLFVVAPRASSSPDGLERVAADTGVDAGVRAHDIDGSPLADYAVAGIDDGALSTGLSGVIGVIITLGVATGLAHLARRRVRPAGEPHPASSSSA